jgi:16S rRNA (guanine966-N2)-methyltransferase
MRIIAGEWRGRKLVSPPGISTRPTADRVRETLFSMLASRLGTFEGLRVADLYAGSGALGLEALSRGAAFASFVEQDRGALDAIRANVASLEAEAKTQILGRAVESARVEASFDLVFADPPYTASSGTRALGMILTNGWVAQGSWIAVETERGDAVEPQGCAIDTERDIGAARLTLLRA